MEKKNVAVCGLYCGICPVYRAPTDRALAKRIASNLGIKAEDVCCLGCRVEKGNISIIGPPICKTYDCCANEKKLEFCYQCPEFPCLKLVPCADRAQEIPHNTKIYGLLRLKKVGVEGWIKEAGNIRRLYFIGKKKRAGNEPRT